MNKDKVYLKGYVIGHAADTLGYQGLMVQLENLDVVEIDKNLVHKKNDEPQKPVVQQFVANWYEEHKDDLEFNIWDWIKYTHEEEKVKNRQFTEWLGESENAPVETLIKMKLFGYEVEKEKRYRVSLKNGQPLLKAFLGKALYFSQDIAIESYKVTRKELEEAGFGDVFDSPLFEVEEVEG